jgi:hypothetical protein
MTSPMRRSDDTRLTSQEIPNSLVIGDAYAHCAGDREVEGPPIVRREI